MGKKLLFILGGMDVGGVQTGIMNFAKLVNPDEIHIDVLVHSDKIGFHEKFFREYGEVFHIPTWEDTNKFFLPIVYLYNNIYFYKKLKKFLRENHYDIIHSKSLGLSAASVKAAKDCGVSVRIAHAHVDKPEHLNLCSRLYYIICASVIEKNATCKLAVSPKASDLMFCEYGGTVIKNPTISLERLNPNKYRSEPHNEIRMIQIGTYSMRKNQMFAVKILKCMLNNNIETHLTFVGYSLDEPDYINQIKNYVENLNLTNYISFFPKNSDIPLLLSENDYMLIPSLREGLPNVALEAQAMGLPCFVSDTVYRGADCGLCEFLSLNDGADSWAKYIVDYRNKYGAHKHYVDMSQWDNKNIIGEYIKIWNGEQR